VCWLDALDGNFEDAVVGRDGFVEAEQMERLPSVPIEPTPNHRPRLYLRHDDGDLAHFAVSKRHQGSRGQGGQEVLPWPRNDL
jgi:hypothetical protein